MNDLNEVTCRHCGAKNKAEAIECEVCGNYIDEELDPGEAMAPGGQSLNSFVKFDCPKCGHKNYENARSCESCGLKFYEDHSTSSARLSAGRNGYPALETISGIYRVFAILVIVGGAVVAIATFSSTINTSSTVALATLAATAILVAVTALSLFAMAEGIHLFIDIESHLRNLPERLKSKQ